MYYNKYNRYLRIYLEDTKNKYKKIQIDEQMDVEINTNQGINGDIGECNIIVKGLTSTHMATIATQTLAYISQDPLRYNITIDIGYYNKHSIIFNGQIQDASPNFDSINYSINLHCFSGYNVSSKSDFEFVGEKGETLKTMLTRLAKEVELKGVDFGKDTTLPFVRLTEDYNFGSGLTLFQHMKNIQAKFLEPLINIGVDNKTNKIIVRRRKGNISNKIKTINSNEIVGGLKLDNSGIDMTIIMDTSISFAYNIIINSYRYKQLKNKIYYLQSYSFVAETRGDKWFTNLKLNIG